jgi:hypothetical protein
MIINWKGEGVLTVQPIDTAPFIEAQKNTDRIRRTEEIRDICQNVDAVVFTPGWNEIDDAVWFLCRAHVMKKIESGQIEEMSKEAVDENGNKIFVGMKPSDFKNRQGAANGPEMLVTIIKGCYSMPTLKRWIENEVRDEIRMEMKKQLELLTDPPKEDQKYIVS